VIASFSRGPRRIFRALYWLQDDSMATQNQTIAVLGAGAWGSALAVMLARGGRRVRLCVRRKGHLAQISAAGENKSYLPGVAIPDSIELSADWHAAIGDADGIVLAVPSRHARAAVQPLADSVRAGAIFMSATKGIEEGTLLTMTALIRELAGNRAHSAVLSGPGFAAEISRGRPAALVAAASDEAIAIRVRDLFASRTVRVYSSTDVIGVELAGAAKNVIAIAAGACDGLGLGSSARAAVITRGLAEIMRLAEAAGGRRDTIAGLSGLGDLVLTCTGDLSRNRAAGIRLARGEALEVGEDAAEGRPVAEGIANARAIRTLGSRLGVEMPIVEGVYRALYEAAAPATIVSELLSRELKPEF
jgi:glycerol-3-phosphate dehydrogenase (NAD(P)+)